MTRAGNLGLAAQGIMRASRCLMDRMDSGGGCGVNGKDSVPARDVVCPHCTAEPGRPCVDMEMRHMRTFHARRHRAAAKRRAA